MKDEKETKKHLLICAKQEFMEKGYMSASLRNICKNAGVTTGALYFFFKDKEDLFASLVEEPLTRVYQVMIQHYSDELAELAQGEINKTDDTNDREAFGQIIHYLYQYYDEIQLILTKSQGSRFQNSLNQFVEISEKHYRLMADVVCEQRQIPKMDDYMIHWLAHMLIDAFVHMFLHEKSEKEALKHVDYIMKYLMHGWYGLYEI